ncbi:FCD domain-containing protein [Jiella pelagia]|uniref:FCD domain-containing protein n=1 Tax=Jiella pelagia TaxID=2986949 RepID=UPI0038B3E1E9
MDDLSLRTLPWRGAQFRARASRIEEPRREHRAVLDAILSRDSIKVASLMRSHIGASFVGIVEMVRQRVGTFVERGRSASAFAPSGRNRGSGASRTAEENRPLRLEPQRDVP